MENKKYIILSCTFLVLSALIIILSFQDSNVVAINITEINDIVESIKSNWNNLDENNLPGKLYKLDYVVLDKDDNLIAATKSGLNTDIISAVKNKDTIIYITNDDLIIGKILFYNNSKVEIHDYRIRLLITSLVNLFVIFISSIIYNLYLDNLILKPFKKLQRFSHQISLGNLDIPLEMDKNNWFGSFTESFDIMRTELYIARENERKANQSKKELVASLSHDIKTPIASIKSVCELMSVKSDDPEEIKQLEVINAKAEQINTLITNLFNATLEELQELKINLTNEPSIILKETIQKSDYNNKCSQAIIPECLIVIDKIRIEQVIDNIISNSYKYANTPISVNAVIIDDYLELEFKDYGKSINETEIPLLLNKFYRGSNASNKTGTGLGLYISNNFMKKMSGELNIFYKDGFIVQLKILIS